ncbi:DNA cytosine methyltransferase [Tenacibaculum sp. Mcav3-52]|uniref:DNA cytosine methyltransferase n=1 Tax=Tenacibaculum sp. Mcav3-52 TaxID=2917762 RepID=UPI001EF329D1|nr:DNA cytosine methyltransferase [Tenacibaculum sp. Mcav3-52]MCG7500598.1 DNA cytosine methyltransferase [Tenacibaculum sp. Mcav3-52]
MNTENGINVLSLFDGISVAQLALKQLNIPINNYYASEIDKNPIKVTQHHFPGTIQLGDVRSIDTSELLPIDLMVFGSPCQDLSSLRKNRSGLAGEKSSLFYEALRILQEVKPKYYLMENVGSMSKRDRKIISDLLGVEPIQINSSLVGPALRNRLYWTNIPNVSIPTDNKIILQKSVENGWVDKRKANAILTKNVPYTRNGLIRYLTRSIGQVVFLDKDFCYESKERKLELIEDMNDEEVKKLFRPFTISELENMQTLPYGYVSSILKPTPGRKSIGNSFTLDSVKHILSHADFNTTMDE